MARNYKKHIIWQSVGFVTHDCEDVKEAYQDMLDANGWDESDYSIYDFIYDESEANLDAEISNLSSLVYDNKIIGIADLGLWNGRRSAYSMSDYSRVSDILRRMADNDTEFYVENVDLYVTHIHHDGRNYYRFRRWKDGVTESQKETLRSALWNQETDKAEKLILRLTTGIGRDIKRIYGMR